MNSLLGKRLSHYKVIERLGAGGMGVVFRAFDEQLEREVALKVLAGGLLADEPSRKRFCREVLAISQLSHPNIASVYDFDTQGDLVFLAMELVPGETLAQDLGRGPLQIMDAMNVGIQLASALEWAHERGVIHRDLKPSNILRMPSGVTKVVDFGLAGYIDEEIRGDDDGKKASGSRVLKRATNTLTEAGKVMGTPGYMSPEQVRAQPQDPRTDIFSFGCVLFELLSARHAFPGTSVQEVISATLAGEPSWDALPPNLPLKARDLLRRCLEKGVAKRPEAIREVRLVLEDLCGVGSAHRDAKPRRRPTPHNLPTVPTSFVGRDVDLLECTGLLADARLVTLLGPGGCGKTRLAIHLAETLMEEYSDGLWFLDLAPLTDGQGVEKALAAALGVRTDSDSLSSGLVARLRGKRALIILDNCEHLLEASAKLAQQLLATCPNARCLATSREVLGTPGERSYLVPSLSVPKAQGDQSADSVAPYESVRLFLDRASTALPDYGLSDKNAPVIAEICRRLDGIPLGIELAAAHVKSLTIEEIRSKLDDRFRLLTGETAGPLPRHQTLRATIQWSDDLLLDVERWFLRALAVFAGGWTLEAAARVAGEVGHELQVLDLMNRLVDKSLVVIDRTPDRGIRYRLLESIRQYALEHLIGTDREIRVRDRHSEAFLLLAEEAERGLVGSEQGTWLGRLELEHQNLLAAIEWCARPSGDIERGLRIAGAIWRFWYGRGYFTVGRSALERLLQAAGSSPPPLAHGRALRAAGVLAYYQADYAAARLHLGGSLALYRSLQDKQNIARGLNGLAGVAMDELQYDEARTLLEESLSLSREIGDRGGVGVALGNLGTLAKYQGNDLAARGGYEGALVAFREAGDLGNVASILFDLGAVQTRLGETEAARTRLTDCLMLSRDLGEKRIAAYATDAVADLVSTWNDPTRATRLLGAASGIRKRIGAPLMPNEQKQRDITTYQVRSQLPRSRFDSEWAAGAKMSFEAAVEYGLATLAEGESKSKAVPAITTHAAALGEGSASLPTPAESTAHLLARVRGGDAAASHHLVKKYLPVLRRWAHGRLPGEARDLVDTDDLVQVTLVRALQKVGSFELRREGAFLAYLRKILLNQIRDQFRRVTKGPKRESLTVDLLDLAPSPLEATIALGTYMEYEAALARLPEKQREAVILRAELDLSFGEVAEAVGCASDDAARMLVTRGLDRVARLMRNKK